MFVLVANRNNINKIIEDKKNVRCYVWHKYAYCFCNFILFFFFLSDFVKFRCDFITQNFQFRLLISFNLTEMLAKQRNLVKKFINFVSYGIFF